MKGILKFLFSISFFLITKSGISQTIDLEDRRKLMEYISPAVDSAGNAYVLWDHANRGKWESMNIDSLYVSYQELSKKSRQRQVEFIHQNPNSYAALEYFEMYILNSLRYKLDSVIVIFSYFDKALRVSPKGKSIEAVLARKKSLSINSEVPNFSFKTYSGATTYNLASFRGEKYVLICFWASWCGPCIRSIPHLRKIEEAYGNDLQLIQVSIDKDQKSWINALGKYPMPWMQTCDLPPYITGDQVQSIYDIHYIPQYFLIDKEGKLIYQNFLAEDNEDYSKMQEVLKKNLEK